MHYYAWLFTWLLGFKLWSSCLASKHFINWAISPVVTWHLNCDLCQGLPDERRKVESSLLPFCSSVRGMQLGFPSPLFHSSLPSFSIHCIFSLSCGVTSQLARNNFLPPLIALSLPPQLLLSLLSFWAPRCLNSVIFIWSSFYQWLIFPDMNP